MRAAIFHGKEDIRIDQVPDPEIQAPTDAIIRITRTAICGSDLWFYRGLQDYKPGSRTGHEPMGIVEEVGAEVEGLTPGDLVLAPFAISDGTCEFCQHGIHTSCNHGGFWAGITDGAQGQFVRAPLADGTLVRVPEDVHGDEAMLDALFPLTDVMGTGHHAAVCAGVEPGATVVVIGDGAVGLCGVLAAHRLGAARIIAVGHHTARLELARRFGATDVVSSRGDAATGEILDMTEGGARHVLECVGGSLNTGVGDRCHRRFLAGVVVRECTTRVAGQLCDLVDHEPVQAALLRQAKGSLGKRLCRRRTLPLPQALGHDHSLPGTCPTGKIA